MTGKYCKSNSGNSTQRWEILENSCLFHGWRSFHYDENLETIDAYVNHIRQVATLLGYEELQVLEVFKTLFLKDATGFCTYR